MPQADPSVAVKSKYCRYCGNGIDLHATYCAHCSNYQSRWRTELKYWSGAVGLIALIFSGVAFTTNFAQQLYDRLLGEDVVVSDVSTTDFLRVWNTSESGILVTEIGFSSTAPEYNLVWPSSLIIKPGMVSEVNLLRRAKLEWQSKIAVLLNKKLSGYVADIKPIEEQGWVESMEPFIDQFVPDFLAKSGAEYRQQKELFGDKLFTFGCTGYLVFTKISDGSENKLDIPCIGLARRVLN